MMPLLHLLSLCILILTLLIMGLCCSSIAGSKFVLPPAPSTPISSNCTTSRCAPTLPNISFPFSIMDPNMPSTCGLPDFRLNCNGTLISWWPERVPFPLASILNITTNQITSGTFVAGPLSFSPHINACSPLQQHSLFSSSPYPLPLGLQFFPYGNIVLLTDCSKDLTSKFDVNETVDGFSFSSPSCFHYYSVCQGSNVEKVPCLEAISADANVSLVRQIYGCSYNISLFELPETENMALSLQISWTISQSYYDCKACEGSNGSCTVNNVTDSFRCSCPNDGHASSPSITCGSADTPQSCKGLCQSNVQIFLGTTVVAIVILIVGAAGFGLYYCRRRERNRQGSGRQLQMSGQSQGKDQLKQILARETSAFPAYTRKFSYRELCAATDGFAESKVLGDGGFGTVYEGTLACSGEIVAVKQLYSENTRRFEQFLNEIRILTTLNHPNLVRLHGFCCESFAELLLVYEFASNGSLADNLHGITGKGGLMWETRLCIALETAGALAYMHERDPPILHRDVKSSNILLDDKLHAKLADFGLSRRVFAMRSTIDHVSTAPQGTPGYVDPQYQQCYRLTDKSDVYSFGVVLMELISGKAPVDMSRRHNDHINLSSLAVAKIQTGALHELIDPFLLQEFSSPHMHDMVARVAELAFLCLAPLQDDRPSMPQVALALLDIARSSCTNSNVSSPPTTPQMPHHEE